MKKLISIFVLLIVTIGLWIFIFGNPVSKVDPTDFLPANSYAYLEQRDGEKTLGIMLQSPLGQALINLNYEQILTSLKVPEANKKHVLKTIDDVLRLKDNQLLKDVFGKQLVIGILPNDTAINLDDPFKNIKDRAVIITKPKYSAGLLEKLAEQFFDSTVLSTSSYQGKSIKKITHASETLSAISVDGYFIMSYQEELIRRCIDVYEKTIPSLTTDQEFNLHSSNDKNYDRFAYLALDKIRIAAIENTETLPEPYRDMVKDELSTSEGFKSASYFASRDSQRLNEDIVVLFDKEKLNKYAKQELSIKPTKNNTTSWISENNVAYYWANTLDLMLIWDAYVKESDYLPQLIMIEETFYSLTNVQFTDFLQLFTGEMAFFFEKSNSGQLIPTPNFGTFMKVSDRDKVLEVFNKILANYGVSTTASNHKGVSYSYVGPFLQKDLQPLFGVYENYVFVANSPLVANRLIDVIKDHALAIDFNKVFPNINTGVLSENNVVAYAKIDDFLLEIKKILNWSKAMLAMQDQALEQQADELLEYLVFPIMEGASMYKETISRSSFTEDSIVIESNTNIAQ